MSGFAAADATAENMMQSSSASCTYRIWIAGDVNLAKAIVRDYCDNIGDCYAVTAVSYIFTDGSADGVCVSRIQYPRFPISPAELMERVEDLAELLREGLCQKSFTVEGPNLTTWHSEED